jgi:hypothetical protein
LPADSVRPTAVVHNRLPRAEALPARQRGPPASI